MWVARETMKTHSLSDGAMLRFVIGGTTIMQVDFLGLAATESDWAIQHCKIVAWSPTWPL
jgi:hypothetical protein